MQHATLNHAISFHVIFQKVFDVKDLFKVLQNPDYIFVKDGVDMSVYKDENKQQLLRHAFSIKNKSFTDICHTEIDFTSIPQLYKASELVVTPDGSEEVGTLDELKEAFQYDESKESIENAKNSLSSALNNIKSKQHFNIASKDVSEDVEKLLRSVCNKEFKHDSTIHDIAAFIPASKNEYINSQFINCYTKLYNEVAHSTPEDIDKLYEKLTAVHGFCSCMSNIKNAYYSNHNYDLIQRLRKESKNQTKACKFTDAERDELKSYKEFVRAYHKVVDQYFEQYDYIHTTANEEKFLQRCNNKSKIITKQYKRLYVRKILYIANEKYLYRKNLYDTASKALDNKSFQIYLRRLYGGIGNIDETFNNNLQIFHKEDMLETSDGLVYPRYRDLDFKDCLTDDEFKEFEAAYKATFKHECCADLAFKLMIQDIASGFHDNSGIIKFYYGKGGNNKDCETSVYENIIGCTDLVFKTSTFDVLVDEKNKQVVESLYVQFNEMPSTNKDRFDNLINALKNYNECGKQKTRGLYQDFVTINCNIRFQCNTNHPILRDWLLDNANDAIKRRFLVAERVHSDEHSDWLWEFSHDVKKCRALKTYIKNHSKELYTDKLNTMKMLQFYKDHEDIYAKYTEAKANDEFEELKDALCNCGCIKGKRTLESEDEYIVNIKEWYKMYISDHKGKCSETTFRSKVDQYTSYTKHCYVGDKRTSNKYFIVNDEMINALSERNANIDVSE